MKTKPHTLIRAQAMMEYILVMCVIVVIVFVGFRNTGNTVLDRTHDQAESYFNTGSTAIMGGYYDGGNFVRVDPSPVNGGWCAWTTCINHVRTRECACPRPAFGGRACDARSPNAGGSGAAAQGC